MPQSIRSSKKKGVTLIESIASVVIISILLIALYSAIINKAQTEIANARFAQASSMLSTDIMEKRIFNTIVPDLSTRTEDGIKITHKKKKTTAITYQLNSEASYGNTLIKFDTYNVGK